MTQLSVNVNKIALLRNQRPLNIPSVLEMSRIALAAGAAGITVHPRPDQRHIRTGDVYELAGMLRGCPGAEFNIEGYPDQRYMQLVAEVRPQQATLVPDAPEQATSDHGWNLPADGAKVAPVVGRLKDLGIRVSLFMDPDVEQIRQAAAMGADRVELYTEPYASAFARKSENGGATLFDATLRQYVDAGKAARDAGMGLNAGHDLSLKNLATLLGAVAGIEEVSIGHALIAEALELGLAATVREYVRICRGG